MYAWYILCLRTKVLYFILEGNIFTFHHVLDVYAILGTQAVLTPTSLKFKKQVSYAKRRLRFKIYYFDSEAKNYFILNSIVLFSYDISLIIGIKYFISFIFKCWLKVQNKKVQFKKFNWEIGFFFDFVKKKTHFFKIWFYQNSEKRQC